MKGKIALVTGGSKGIGYGVAQALLEQGMHVAITGRDQAALHKAVEQLTKAGDGTVMGIKADVKSWEDQQQMVEKLLDKWGALHVLVANAGVGHFAPIDQMTHQDWHDTIDTNLTGVFYSIKSCLESIRHTQGYIITIASLAGTNFFAGGSAYNASKFGLVGFTQAIMLDLRNQGVKVSTIMPGSVNTHFNDHVPDESGAWKIQAEDIGELVVDLLKMNPRTLPSKIEVRPTMPPSK